MDKEKKYENYVKSLRKTMASIFAFDNGYYCPSCYNKKFLVPTDSDNIICSECEWEGPRSECYSEGEFKNKLRTELIDKILL